MENLNLSKNWQFVWDNITLVLVDKADHLLTNRDVQSSTNFVIGLSISISLNIILIVCGIELCRYFSIWSYKKIIFVDIITINCISSNGLMIYYNVWLCIWWIHSVVIFIYEIFLLEIFSIIMYQFFSKFMT